MLGLITHIYLFVECHHHWHEVSNTVDGGCISMLISRPQYLWNVQVIRLPEGQSGECEYISIWSLV